MDISQDRKEQLIGIAKRAHQMGFIPIPLIGKRPFLPKWEQTTREKSLKKIEDTIRSANNIGILTGKPSGIVVIDIDLREQGVEKWKEYIKDKEMPQTFTVITGTGGYHYYYKYDDKVDKIGSTKVKGRGIDYLSNGKQVVFPGSINMDTGKLYVIIDGYSPDNNGIYQAVLSSMPDHLVRLIQGL